MLESYDGSLDLAEHIVVFRVQMALYDTSNTLIRHAFPATLWGLAQKWYSQLKPSSILSFDQLIKEFELNFLAIARPKPTAVSLFSLRQKDEEPLGQFVMRFAVEIRGVPNAHHSLVIQSLSNGIATLEIFLITGWASVHNSG
ncbi:hypothetical protein GW17_00062017 [Ensete ventricosum]|nr:hypothetical protein GW17_00062017 [Ensete ventricosum]